MITGDSTVAKPVNILIVDDHPMVRDGIKTMLTSKDTAFLFRLSEAEDGIDAIKKAQSRTFDIVLLDYTLPEANGADVAEQIFRIQPDVRILAMSSFPELLYVVKMRDAGASGFILKNIQTTELLAAIRDVLNGKIYYSAPVANKLLQTNSGVAKTNANRSARVSPQELKILKLIVMEKTNKEIADELYIGERTVETHRKNLMHKLQVKNTAGLIRAGYESNLLP
jgi:DNA-binding NarL/FixJ family response regulator